MKYARTEWWVEYNFKNDVPMNIRVFKTHEEAETFAKEYDGKVIETEAYK